ncbi:unnamed protein product [Musa acuminata subsp. malaccensis]|uniref:(wild Malaysian banana) hypothetical protein n=1 Tax=Musa acuminata subsp. malaccensis TaxID=214687 RepID=A0A804KX24_MUSAM|nr:unnamed protein product [Musa acuminata subsp. malaccensis]
MLWVDAREGIDVQNVLELTILSRLNRRVTMQQVSSMVQLELLEYVEYITATGQGVTISTYSESLDSMIAQS